MKPCKHQGTNKDARIYVERSTTVQNLFVCADTLCTNRLISNRPQYGALGE